jgi:hypothetical protein
MVSLPALSDFALDATLRRVLNLLDDNYNYQVTFPDFPAPVTLSEHLDTGEFAFYSTKRNLILHLGPNPQANIQITRPTIPYRDSPLLKEFLERSKPELASAWLLSSRSICDPSPVTFPGDVYPSTTFDPVLFSSFLHSKTSAHHPVRIPGHFPGTFANYLQFELPSGFDTTDLNPCHCIVAHFFRRTDITSLLGRVVRAGAARRTNFRQAIVNYVWHWLSLFPADFCNFSASEISATGQFANELRFFESPIVKQFANYKRPPLPIKGRPIDILAVLNPSRIAKFFTIAELGAARAISCWDILSMSPAVTGYIDRVDRTIRLVKRSLRTRTEENFELWMEVLIECVKYNNFQLGFEVLAGFAGVSPPIWDRFRQRARPETIFVVNQIVNLYDSANEYEVAVKRMGKITDPENALGFFVPVLMRLKDLFQATFAEGVEVDAKKIRLILDLCRIVLKKWGAGGVDEVKIDQVDLPLFRTIVELKEDPADEGDEEQQKPKSTPPKPPQMRL